MGNCRTGRLLMNIDHRGNVARCTERLDEPVGNILTEDIATIRDRLWHACRHAGLCRVLDLLPRLCREHVHAAAHAAVSRVLSFREATLTAGPETAQSGRRSRPGAGQVTVESTIIVHGVWHASLQHIMHAGRDERSVGLRIGVATASHAGQVERVGILEGVDEDRLESPLGREEHAPRVEAAAPWPRRCRGCPAASSSRPLLPGCCPPGRSRGHRPDP